MSKSRAILFTDANSQSRRVSAKLPGNILNPPKFLQFEEKLYKYSGSGMGGLTPVNFYREVVDFTILEDYLDMADK